MKSVNCSDFAEQTWTEPTVNLKLIDGAVLVCCAIEIPTFTELMLREMQLYVSSFNALQSCRLCVYTIFVQVASLAAWGAAAAETDDTGAYIFIWPWGIYNYMTLGQGAYIIMRLYCRLELLNLCLTQLRKDALMTTTVFSKSIKSIIPRYIYYSPYYSNWHTVYLGYTMYIRTAW